VAWGCLQAWYQDREAFGWQGNRMGNGTRNSDPHITQRCRELVTDEVIALGSVIFMPCPALLALTQQAPLLLKVPGPERALN
jgi:hypothetical protein